MGLEDFAKFSEKIGFDRRKRHITKAHALSVAKVRVRLSAVSGAP